MVKRNRKADTAVVVIYAVLVIAVFSLLIRGLVMKSMSDVFYCALVLFEYAAVWLVFRTPKIRFPAAFKISVAVFIFAAQILAQVFGLMRSIAYWDLILHTTSGFLIAALGVSLISILNKNTEILPKMSSAFILLVAFSFSMMTAVVWEFSESAMDTFMELDTQKDTVIDTVISEMLNPGNDKPAMKVENITETVIYGTVNGEETAVSVKGYLDIGKTDTMEDMFVHFVGTAVFLIFCGLGMKKGGGAFWEAFVPHRLTDEEAAEASSRPIRRKNKA